MTTDRDVTEKAMISSLADEIMAGWAKRPCECAARAARTEFPLAPEHVECQSCKARAYFARRARAGR